MRKSDLYGFPLTDKNGKWTGCALCVGPRPRFERTETIYDHHIGLYENESISSRLERLKKYKRSSKLWDLDSYLDMPCICRTEVKEHSFDFKSEAFVSEFIK